jgi:hypothetical protein
MAMPINTWWPVTHMGGYGLTLAEVEVILSGGRK